MTTVKLGTGLKFHPQAFWNADGTRIYYRDPVEQKKPTDDPKNDLVAIRLDGTDARHLLRFPPVDDIVPSPDGAWVVFTSRDNVYVTALPGILTKEPPEVSLKEGAVPVYRLSDDAGGYVRWADGGKTMTWALGNTFYRLTLSSALEFARAERRKAEEKEKAKAAEGKSPGREPRRTRTTRRRRRSRRRRSRRPRRSRSRSRCPAPRPRARTSSRAPASSR